MISSQRTLFDLRHRMHLHALVKNFPMRDFQVASPNFGAIHESRKHQSLEQMGFEFPTCDSDYRFLPSIASNLGRLIIFIRALEVLYIVHANVAMLLDFVWQRSQPCGLRVNVYNTYRGGVGLSFACFTNPKCMHDVHLTGT